MRPTSFRILASTLALIMFCAIVTAAGIGGDLGAWIKAPFGFGPSSSAASSANYTFAASTSGTLADMRFGTAQLVAADSDDAASPVVPIGFDFYLMGNRYSQFSANSNGTSTAVAWLLLPRLR